MNKGYVAVTKGVFGSGGRKTTEHATSSGVAVPPAEI